MIPHKVAQRVSDNRPTINLHGTKDMRMGTDDGDRTGIYESPAHQTLERGRTGPQLPTPMNHHHRMTTVGTFAGDRPQQRTTMTLPEQQPRFSFPGNPVIRAKPRERLAGGDRKQGHLTPGIRTQNNRGQSPGKVDPRSGRRKTGALEDPETIHPRGSTIVKKMVIGDGYRVNTCVDESPHMPPLGTKNIGLPLRTTPATHGSLEIYNREVRPQESGHGNETPPTRETPLKMHITPEH